MFEIRTLTSDDEAEVIDLVLKYYSRDHFKKLYGLKGKEIDIYNIEKARNLLRQSWSLGVFEKKTKKLVGVSLNTIKENNRLVEQKRNGVLNKNCFLSKDLQQVELFLNRLGGDVFDLLKVEKVFYIVIAIVHNDYRQYGILNSFGKEIDALASMSGCQYIITLITNEYLCRVFPKFGFKALREINYVDYNKTSKTKLFKQTKFPYLRAMLLLKDTNPFPSKL